MFSHIKSIKLLSLATILLVLGLSSCKPIDVFEKSTTIPGHQWSAGFAAEGSFAITDTSSAYNIYIVLRHTDAYNYNNIWLNLGIQHPGDSLRKQKLNLLLATEAKGWDGTGMNDIWEARKRINAEPVYFSKVGTYKFSITQIMRDDPLKHVLSAGLRVEKAL